MNLNVQVNKNLIDFYNTCPTSEINDNFMTRWAMYANTPMEQEVQKQLYPIFQEKIASLNERDAVDKLLNWVQTALVYEYDDKVWGHDRAFFAEETLFYPYCDCEDRAILFTRIVRDLLVPVTASYRNHRFVCGERIIIVYASAGALKSFRLFIAAYIIVKRCHGVLVDIVGVIVYSFRVYLVFGILVKATVCAYYQWQG